MNANEYQKLAARTECQQSKSVQRMATPLAGMVEDAALAVLDQTSNDSYSLTPIRVNHAVIGLAGEVGEIASLVQKWIYYGKSFKGNELKAALMEETGDVLWYVALMLNALGLNMEAVMKANIAKLRVRYPDKYTDVLAAEESRDRKKEAMAVGYGGKIINEIPLGEPEMCNLGQAGSLAESIEQHHESPIDLGADWVKTIGPASDRKSDVVQDGQGFGHVGEGSVEGCKHEWQPIQSPSGSGLKCKLCGAVESMS